MFKPTEEGDDYCVMDELAILCCFYKIVKFQAEDKGNEVLFPRESEEMKRVTPLLKELVHRLYDSKSLVGLRPKVIQALDLVLDTHVTEQTV